jgi:hypothetical protein
MVYNIQNHWVCGLFPLSGILDTRKHDVSETGFVFFLRRGGRYILCSRNIVFFSFLEYRTMDKVQKFSNFVTILLESAYK